MRQIRVKIESSSDFTHRLGAGAMLDNLWTQFPWKKLKRQLRTCRWAVPHSFFSDKETITLSHTHTYNSVHYHWHCRGKWWIYLHYVHSRVDPSHCEYSWKGEFLIQYIADHRAISVLFLDRISCPASVQHIWQKKKQFVEIEVYAAD